VAWEGLLILSLLVTQVLILRHTVEGKLVGKAREGRIMLHTVNDQYENSGYEGLSQHSLTSHQHIIGHLGDDSLQSVTFYKH